VSAAATSHRHPPPPPLTPDPPPSPPAPRRTAFATDEAIASEVDRIRKEMFNARIKFAKREDFKPAQYGDLRSRVAQLLTIKREREIAAGVSKREARATEKRFLAEAGLGRL
jgi:large subunit ribosomal protein L29